MNRDLVIASFHGDPARVERLVAEGAKVDGRCGLVPTSTFKGKEGGYPIAASEWTPLIAAASSDHAPAVPDGHRRVVQILLAYGASPDLDDGYGATALYSAVCRATWSKDTEPIVHDLLKAGANVNTKTGVYIDGSGDITPLHRATSSDSMMIGILGRGVDVDARTTEGATPLHWAVTGGHLESVRLLLQAGAKVNVSDKRGRTPLSWVSSVERKRRMRQSVLEDPSLSEEDKKEVIELIEKAPKQASEDPRRDQIEALLRQAGATD